MLGSARVCGAVEYNIVHSCHTYLRPGPYRRDPYESGPYCDEDLEKLRT